MARHARQRTPRAREMGDVTVQQRRAGLAFEQAFECVGDGKQSKTKAVEALSFHAAMLAVLVVVAAVASARTVTRLTPNHVLHAAERNCSGKTFDGDFDNAPLAEVQAYSVRGCTIVAIINLILDLIVCILEVSIAARIFGSTCPTRTIAHAGRRRSQATSTTRNRTSRT